MSAHETSRFLWLASRSPRRLRMLREAGFAVRQIDPPFADPADPAEGELQDARTVALDLAGRKLISVLNDLQSAETVGGALVLSADTVGQNVAGQLIGTPETSDQALDMLRNLVGRRHTIVSAAAWADCGKHHAIVDEATVEIGAVSDDELQAYVATGQWQGKAGGYNLAERLAAGWSITVEGDPDTVMGLPMQQLLPKLLASGLQREGTLQKV